MKHEKEKKTAELQNSRPEMAQQISQSVLLLDIYVLTDLIYVLTNLSSHMATVSAMSLIPNIFVHSAAVSELLVLKIFLAHDTTT